MRNSTFVKNKNYHILSMVFDDLAQTTQKQQL